MRLFAAAFALLTLSVVSVAHACPSMMNAGKQAVIAGTEGTTLPQTPRPVQLPSDSRG
jgi:hypothetical protein